jgi:hypothetical protein
MIYMHLSIQERLIEDSLYARYVSNPHRGKLRNTLGSVCLWFKRLLHFV